LGQRFLLLYITLEKIVGELRIQLLQTVVLLQRGFPIIQRHISEGKIEMRFAIIRLDPDGFPETRRSFLIALRAEVNRA
jgi:hypothetical protein